MVTFKMLKKKITVDKEKINNTKILKQKDCFLAIILKENTGFTLKWVNFGLDIFRHNENTYYPLRDGMYIGDKKLIIAVYLEGVSTPIGHKNIIRTKVTRSIVKEGKTVNVTLDLIKGLKFDSKIIDVLLMRGLAQEFTEQRPDKTIFILFCLVVINIIVTCIAVGVNFL